ncbi:MAG: hypothetical protein ACU88J_15385 [Gammaproteobacteria bacterium]
MKYLILVVESRIHISALFVFIFLIFICGIGTSHARITRSCNGEFEVWGTTKDAWPGLGTTRPPHKRAFNQFSATRGCPNGRPDLCRKRARDAVWDCLRDAFDALPNVAANCAANEVNGYQATNLILEAAKLACCDQNFPDPLQELVISGRSSGDKGCGFEDPVPWDFNSHGGFGSYRSWTSILFSGPINCETTRQNFCPQLQHDKPRRTPPGPGRPVVPKPSNDLTLTPNTLPD